ncbi:MAG: HEAT repeat domain-containing protein, partial [Proteobacteria bacterium]|nr:HEAT repeat domain-containing protein [Pseudomonadota bacterium]
MARATDFDLAAALATPNFTPGRRDAAALAQLIVGGAEPVATRAARALAQLADGAREAVDTAWTACDEGARTRLVGVLGQLARAGDETARASLLGWVSDELPRVRRAAISALGKLGVDDKAATLGADLSVVRAALLARWGLTDLSPEEKRSLAEALGKLGGEAALATLRALDATGDRELARRRDRAVLMADRDARRDEPSEIAIDVAPPEPLRVRLGCRAGLGALLADELREHGLPPLAATDRTVDVTLAGPWSALHASRLWATAAIRI